RIPLIGQIVDIHAIQVGRHAAIGAIRDRALAVDDVGGQQVTAIGAERVHLYRERTAEAALDSGEIAGNAAVLQVGIDQREVGKIRRLGSGANGRKYRRDWLQIINRLVDAVHVDERQNDRVVAHVFPEIVEWTVVKCPESASQYSRSRAKQ